MFPSNLINQTGKGGAELNKEFSGLLNPFSPTKFYKLKQSKQEVIGIWETINQNSIDPKTGRPATLLRNKLTNEERYEINYEKPEKLTATEIENDIKRKETKKAAQSEYDAIMKSRRVTKEELLTRFTLAKLGEISATTPTKLFLTTTTPKEETSSLF